MLSSNKPRCHPRLPKCNLKTLLLNWNILKKQLFQAASCSDHGCHGYHSYLIRSSRLQKSSYSWVSFLLKLQAYSLKKKLHQRCFPVSVPNISAYFTNDFHLLRSFRTHEKLLPLLFSVCLILFCWLMFACESFEIFSSKKRKKNRLEIVLITTFYYTTKFLYLVEGKNPTTAR